ncbi:hypothetical protein CC80DRAFT_568026 [Byssothecium circinans]|uniref:Uncharacterized protein n=1 Tax=Byssothecium circinans TaxID=147558 RepID=A0A6A5TQG8_9PLEO|nr:hypothetical protein CC80DRAFT_568026 [Byssothecium circinans]
MPPPPQQSMPSTTRSRASSTSTPIILPRGEATLRTLERLDNLNTHITNFYAKTSTLYSSSKTSVLHSEREAAATQLKTLIEQLEKHIAEHQEAVKIVDREDILGLYVVAGMTRRDAVVQVKSDFEKVEGVVRGVRESARDMLADIVYGSDEKEGREVKGDLSGRGDAGEAEELVVH